MSPVAAGLPAADTETRSILKAVLDVASVGMPEESVMILQTWLACRTAADPSDQEGIAVCKRCADVFLRTVLEVMIALCDIELVATADILWKTSSKIWTARTEEWEDAGIPF